MTILTLPITTQINDNLQALASLTGKSQEQVALALVEGSLRAIDQLLGGLNPGLSRVPTPADGALKGSLEGIDVDALLQGI
jgi:hypothetical protein